MDSGLTLKVELPVFPSSLVVGEEEEGVRMTQVWARAWA